MPAVLQEGNAVGAGIGPHINAAHNLRGGDVDDYQVAPGIIAAAVFAGYRPATVRGGGQFVGDCGADGQAGNLGAGLQVDHGDAAAIAVGYQQGAGEGVVCTLCGEGEQETYQG